MNIFQAVHEAFAKFLKPFLEYKRVKQIRRQYRKIGRNETCPCQSGLKYKKCCWRKDYANNTI